MNQISKINRLPRWNTHSVEALRPFAEVQLVVVDLDGTFLTDSHSTVAPALQTLKRSLRHSRHVRLTIATGRALAGVTTLLVDLELDRKMPIILYNGGLVVRPDGNQIISRALISPDAALEIVNLGRAHSVNVLAYVYGSESFLSSETIKEKVYGWGEQLRFKTEVNGIPVSWQSAHAVTQGFSPIAILIDLRSSPHLLPDLRQQVEIVNLGRAHSVNVLAYVYGSESFLSSETIKEKVYGWGEQLRFKTEVNGIPVSWQSAHAVTQGFSPIAILIDLRSSPHLLPDLRQQVEKVSGISVTISGSDFLECRADKCNKGVALATLADHIGLEDHQILAVGDNDNDAEMLEFAGSGVCVSGASERAKESSDYICRYGVVRGVIEALQIVGQAKRYFQDSTYKRVR